MSHAVSYFNFFYLAPRRDSAKHASQEHTVANLINTTIPNRQCSILSGGSTASDDDENARCKSLHDALIETFDWVGTTEHLNEETLPLLAHLLFQNASMAKSLRSYNVVNMSSMLQTSQLQPPTIQHIEEISQWDQFLWERAQLDFSWDSQ